MKRRLFLSWIFLFGFLGAVMATPPKIYIAFLWHMHQPIYWPYENVTLTQANNRYSYSLYNIFSSRTGPYTNWPKDAVQMGISAGLGHLGAQVSFSGSLVENLNNLEAAGQGFSNWKSSWNGIKTQNTVLGHPRIDMVGFGYFHPLMPLIPYEDIRAQIQKHKGIFSSNFSGNYSKGIFPPENAFAEHIIPALKDENLNWVLVDNIHFDRACTGYPFSTNGNLYEPNKADQLNANPNDWLSLNGLWAPTQNSARWGRRPHFAEYVDPSSGISKKIIVVPADRYMGNEDGQGGFGALSYMNVMSQLESSNTDSLHPILIVLHHDGDNYGGGSPSYYQNNFQSFVNWLQQYPNRFVCTTVEDYLQMFPPDSSDLIHVEPGSWSGADNGDPEFKKWNADYNNCYSYDRNSWAVMTAAHNVLNTAKQRNPVHPSLNQAFNYYYVGQSSDYWYWDGSSGGIWDAHPARAANQAMGLVSGIVGSDQTPPSIWLPQREPYNPGEKEWNIVKSSDFVVWTYAHDISGLSSVKLKYRIDADGQNPISSHQNETYAGGNEVGSWQSISMNRATIPSQAIVSPTALANQYWASITGLGSQLIDYYVEATDSAGNTAKSIIQHVWVGPANSLALAWPNCDTSVTHAGGGGGGGGGIPNGVSWQPASPSQNDTIRVYVGGSGQGGKLHWGVNTWVTPLAAYQPSGSALFQSGPSVETPMVYNSNQNYLSLKIGPFNNPAQVVNKVDFVIHFDDNTWNNNNSQDYHIAVQQISTSVPSMQPNLITAIVPNPGQESVLQIGISSFSRVDLSIIDLQGRIVYEENRMMMEGQHSIALPSAIKSGVYFVRIRAGQTSQTLRWQKLE